MPVETDWLSARVRDFWRDYYETSDRARKRALSGFKQLLVVEVFPSNQWTVLEDIPERFTQNAGLVLRGSFTSQARRFPERSVHVRLLWEDDEIKDEPQGDAVVQFRLRRYLDIPESERKEKALPMSVDFERRLIALELNLSRRDEMISPGLEQFISPIVMPYKLTPLLLLNLHQALEEDREHNRIPQHVDEMIRNGIQPDLLDDSFRELFNETVGAPVEAAEERIVECALEQMFEALYPEYVPLVVVSNWQSSLQKYTNALTKLETSHERQGQVVVEGNKDEIADLFALRNTGLDSFMRSFPAFIEQEEPFSGQERGKVRFTLHPLEQNIRKWLQEATETETIRMGGERHEVHFLPINLVHRRAMDLGYLDKEVDTTLELMVTRGLVDLEERRGILREAITQAPSVDELRAEVDDWSRDLEKLQSIFTTSRPLDTWMEEVEKAKGAIVKLRDRPDDARLITIRRSVRKYRQQLADWAADKHQQLQREVNNLLVNVPQLAEQQERQLKRTVTGSVDYAPQVNDLRNRLLKIQMQLKNDIDQLRQRIQGTRSTLQGENLSYDLLGRLAEKIKSYRSQVEELQDRSNAFQSQFDQYTGWVELVEKGTQLGEQIQQHGELVEAQGEAFQDLSRKIRGHLSANKLNALPDAPTYKMTLGEIAQEVQKLKNEASQAFQTLQDRYRTALTRKLGFPADQLWDRYQYNPVAPRNTRERLREEVRQALEENMASRLHEKIEAEREAVRAPLNSPLLEMLSLQERENLRERGQTLDQELRELSRRLEAVREGLQDTVAIADFPRDEEGLFHRIVADMAQIRDEISSLHTQVSPLSEKLRNLELTQTEEQVLDALEATQAIEVSDLRQTVRDQIADTEFWSALRGLHEKRRIRIQIAVVRHD